MRDRLRPSLLDQLTDARPGERSEGAGDASVSLAQLRRSVLRDLTWLLNAGQLASALDLSSYPEAAASTLNYGAPALTGRETGAINAQMLRRDILAALKRFEPRLVPGTLKVSPIGDARGGALHFTIEADLWAEPQMLHMLMRTEAGDVAGAVRVVEVRGEGR